MKKILICFLLFFFLSKLAFAQTPLTDDLPILAVINPTNNEQIFGSKVNISFIVKNFVFTDFEVRTENETGEGHLNIWLDEQNPTVNNAQKIIRATDFTLENIQPGNHQLIMELVNNDQTSLKPPIREVISFTTIAQKEVMSVTGEAAKDEENEKMKKAQRLTKLSSLSAIALVTITFLAVLGYILIKLKINRK